MERRLHCALLGLHALVLASSETIIGGISSDSVSQVSTMAGSSAALPCSLKSSVPHDSVRLVLWFKEMEEKPIYTVDARDQPLEDARHWSDDAVLEGRAFFRSSAEPGRLTIDTVKPYDAGLYKCRVDWKVQPTTISHANLTVNTPPGKPAIYSESGGQVRLKLGPYQLGQAVEVQCLVVGGRPSPAVTWWRDHQIVDDSFAQLSEFKVENVLRLPSLRRSDLDSILTCQAGNSNSSQPVSTSVKLDLTFGPESVRLVGVRHGMTAGQSYTVECVASGARPRPTISWQLAGRPVNPQLTTSRTSNDQTVTTSSFSLLAEPDMAGQSLSCSAEIPDLSNSRLETSQSLHIHSRVSLGSSMDLQDVKEGDDVYLECEVAANPRPHRVTWYKDGVVVRQDVAGGLILSNLTLVLQRVTAARAGGYSCQPANKEGASTSNTLQLDIKYKPMCAPDQVDTYQVALNTKTEVVCHVLSKPSLPVTFHWLFNTSKEMIDIQQDQMRTNGTESIVDYVPRTALDYGSLLCWAENSVGRQSAPCVFRLVPATAPSPPTNCTLTEQGPTSLAVHCSPGSAGGLQQTFLLEVRGEQNNLLANLSAPLPVFTVRGLQPGQHYQLTVYSSNAAGHSQRVEVGGETFQTEYAESRVHLDQANQFVITPILGALIGVGAALSFVTLSIIIVICCKTKRQAISNRRDGDNSEKERLSLDVAPRKICCIDDESGFKRLYSNKTSSSSTVKINDKASVSSVEQNCGSSPTIQNFRTLQPRRVQTKTFSSFTVDRKNHPLNDRTFSPVGKNFVGGERREECEMKSCDSDTETRVPLLPQPELQYLASEVRCSELELSVTSSGSSDCSLTLSSPPDRESEV